jgi:hypothetical protein
MPTLSALLVLQIVTATPTADPFAFFRPSVTIGTDERAQLYRVLLGFTVIALVAVGIVYQLLGLARDARRFPPPGTFVDVGGYRLHVVCRGNGAPAVLLESAIAASSLSWSRVQPEVARFIRICAYDRAGLGWSEQATTPRTLIRVVDDLHAVITNMHFLRLA